MEFLEGSNLKDCFAKSNLTFDEPTLKNILIQVISGLETVHTQNIIHRDLKPANVFVTDSGLIKLLDFGLVKMLDYTSLTSKPGKDIGTPRYIAPELLRGETVDYRADLYSLGVLIFHLTTGGNYPFIGDTPLELYGRVVNNAPTPPTKYNRSLSSAFENIILKLLAKHPYERTFRHNELKEMINSTPLLVSSKATTSTLLTRPLYPKQCFFSPLMNEKADVEKFVFAGGKMDGIIYPAHFLPTHKASLNLFRNMGIFCFLDPVTYRFTYSSFAQTKSIVALPYIPDPNNVLTPSDLQTLQAQQTYARDCMDFQLGWGCSRLIAPFHFSRNLKSDWIDIDIKLIEEAISYAKSKNSGIEVLAGLCINIEEYSVAANRLALLNRYSRTMADGYIFYVDSLDERTNNSLQINALLDLLEMFQQLGKPVIAGRVGTLGLGLLAAGIDGMTTGIAALTSFSENNLLVNRTSNYDVPKKYYIPKMMLTMPVKMAEDILEDPKNADLRCNCPLCNSSYNKLSAIAKAHFLYVRSSEVQNINTLPNTRYRVEWFLDRVKSAIEICNRIEKQRAILFKRPYYQHLITWLDVFKSTKGVA
jgi:Serine/threonine protein kinase